MVLVVWAKLFKSEWCRGHPKIWSGDRFVSILGCDNWRDRLVCLYDPFQTNYSKRLQQPYIDLRHTVHLKHQNLISYFSKFRDKKCVGVQIFDFLFTGLKIDVKYASGAC